MANPRNLDESSKWIAKQEAFTCGNMFAVVYGDSSYAPDGGWNTILYPRQGVRYAVFSYSTPIGWIDDLGRAVVPPESHSNSTGRHQSIVRQSLKDDPLRSEEEGLLRVEREEEERESIKAYYAAKEERRRTLAREAARRRYWTPERLAAKEAREMAAMTKEVLASLLTTHDARDASGVTRTPHAYHA